MSAPKGPLAFVRGGQFTETGMTLRDWFAGQALAGMLANSDMAASAARLKIEPDAFRSDITTGAFKFADAMIAEREKRT